MHFHVGDKNIFVDSKVPSAFFFFVPLVTALVTAKSCDSTVAEQVTRRSKVCVCVCDKSVKWLWYFGIDDIDIWIDVPTSVIKI